MSGAQGRVSRVLDWRTVDLWAEVPIEPAVEPLARAIEADDWDSVDSSMHELITTVYGRQAMQLIARIPLGVRDDMTALVAAHRRLMGDLKGALALYDTLPAAHAAVNTVRLHLRPLAAPRITAAEATGPVPTAIRTNDLEQRGDFGAFRRIVRWSFVHKEWPFPSNEGQRFLLIETLVLLGVAEALAGRLPLAAGNAREALRNARAEYGILAQARDIEALACAGQGERIVSRLHYLEHALGPRGSAPLTVLGVLVELCPLAQLAGDAALGEVAGFAEYLAMRLGVPRLRLQAQSWRLASQIAVGRTGAAHMEVETLLTNSRGAAPGLRALPLLLHALVTREPADFAEASRTAALVGNVPLLVSAQTWRVALRPTARDCRRLHQLLRASGWRRPVLVPSPIASTAARSLVGTGERSVALLEFATASGDGSTLAMAAQAHLSGAWRTAAIRALARVRTPATTATLRDVASGVDADASLAASLLEQRPGQIDLSAREREVLELAAGGLTDRQIAACLTLSPHTVGRHVANARAKLGAASRAQAVARLREARAP